MKKNIFYLQSQRQDCEPRSQNYENENIWSGLNYFASKRYNEYKIEFEKKPDLEFTTDCGNVFSLFQSLNPCDYCEHRFFTRVFDSFCKEKITSNSNLNKSNHKSESFYKDVNDLMRGTFSYYKELNDGSFDQIILDLDDVLDDKLINITNQRIPLIKAVSISNKSFCLAHSIILNWVCYIAYVHGLYKECAEITRLTAGKSDVVRSRAADKCLGTATPQIIGGFDGPQLWLHVYFSPIDREYLKWVVEKEEEN
jgi:hypothetical protein